MSIQTPFIIVIVILCLLNILIVTLCLLWWLAKKKEKLKQYDDTNILLTKDPKISTKTVNHSTGVTFTIPQTISTDDEKTSSGIDIMTYDTGAKRKLTKIPKLNFEVCYDFRTSEVKVLLLTGQNITKSDNKRVLISTFMSHCNKAYRSLIVHGPHPTFIEEYRFPLESIRLSEDPPVVLKFNIKLIKENEERKAFGSIKMKVEEIFTQRGKGVNPKEGDGIITRNVIRSTILTGEARSPSVMISLAYRMQSSIINVLVVEARDLFHSAYDKDVYARVTLLYREKEFQEKVETVSMTTNPEFKQDCMFNLYELQIPSIENIAFRIDIQSRYTKKLTGQRSHGWIIIGSSNMSSRLGKDHWATMLMSSRAITRWHKLEDENLIPL